MVDMWTGAQVVGTLAGRLWPCAVASAMVLAACSGGSEQAAGVTVRASDFEFSPSEVTIQAGKQIELDFRNEGEIDHEWVIMKKEAIIDPTAIIPFREEDIHWEVVEKLPAGSTEIQTFFVDEPGEYQLVCALPGHIEQGMTGSLRVLS